jgi:copper chaperone
MLEASHQPTSEEILMFQQQSDRLITIHQVSGMSCDHCVHAVTAEVSAVPGVTDVRVDLVAGRVTVTSELPVDRAAIAAAVDEAGYALV